LEYGNVISEDVMIEAWWLPVQWATQVMRANIEFVLNSVSLHEARAIAQGSLLRAQL
jgi:hypothetical protein